MLIACVDGLKGFPEAIESIFPRAQVQLCIVHLLRNSLGYVSWKERKALAAALKPIYTAATAEQAEQDLTEFEARRGDTNFGGFCANRSRGSISHSNLRPIFIDFENSRDMFCLRPPVVSAGGRSGGLKRRSSGTTDSDTRGRV